MDDLAYYRSRIAQEEKAVSVATCKAARGRHEELADAYRLRCYVLEAFPPRGDSVFPPRRPMTATLERSREDA